MEAEFHINAMGMDALAEAFREQRHADVLAIPVARMEDQRVLLSGPWREDIHHHERKRLSRAAIPDGLRGQMDAFEEPLVQAEAVLLDGEQEPPRELLPIKPDVLEFDTHPGRRRGGGSLRHWFLPKQPKEGNALARHKQQERGGCEHNWSHSHGSFKGSSQEVGVSEKRMT
jgi:hypothetical protein